MKFLNEILGTKYPFIQGGMANIATGQFAAACSNAGALGIIGSGGMNVEQLEENIHICRSLTDRPFGVNLMLMNPNTDQMAELVAREHIPFLTTGAGNPGKYIDRWKECGCRIFPVSASVLLAQRLVRSGVDGIIAEGTESGGHVGEMTTMTLLPQMRDALPAEVPVVAAGGIADGRQLAAAFALGACGVQMGTCLLVSKECPIHPNYKAALLKAGDNSTLVTGRTVNSPTRILKNKMARQYIRKEKAGADRMELEKFTLGSLRKAVFDGNIDEGSLMAGQVCGQLTEIRPVAEIFAGLIKDAEEVVKKLELPEIS
ncbi:MAG: nitronate monooxygenase [Lachnospiraceae bacterium]|nr:nitronate monooxygenase [Lachnospiraceae bacterium]